MHVKDFLGCGLITKFSFYVFEFATDQGQNVTEIISPTQVI